jgi:glycosyltransferase involved in cell wall biosynthesis
VRILQLVASEKWTGAAAVVFDQTAALVAAGFEAQFAFVEESPLARRLDPLGWARPLLSKPRGLLDYARDVRRIAETIRRERFDVVHAHLSHDHWLAAAAARGTTASLARTFHHLNHVRRDPLSRGLFARTNGFAHANRAIALRFRAGGPILPPVVDPTRFSPGEGSDAARLMAGIAKDKFVVGTVGKIAAGRGHAEALEAVANLPPAVALLHVGKGPHQPALESRARALGISDRNFWAGYQEELLPELYRAMDVFLFTASGSDQGQRAILEAMASGLPVVALDLPGVRDLVTEGDHGFVARDVEGLVNGIRRLLEDRELRVRFGRRARTRAKDFTAETFAAMARPFYEGLLGGKVTTGSRAS